MSSCQRVLDIGETGLMGNHMVDILTSSNSEVTIYGVSEFIDHYSLSPYRYSPKLAVKILHNEYVEFGQDILSAVRELCE